MDKQTIDIVNQEAESIAQHAVNRLVTKVN